MPIRIEVLDDGKLELFDSEGGRWRECEHLSHALAAAAKILRRDTDRQRRKQTGELIENRRRKWRGLIDCRVVSFSLHFIFLKSQSWRRVALFPVDSR